MWTISDVKAKGKQAFKANYGSSVVAGIVAALFAGGAAAGSSYSTSQSQIDSAMAGMTPEEVAIFAAALLGTMAAIIAILLVLKIFVFNPLLVGAHRFFRLNVEDTSTPLSTIKEGFGDYGRVFLTLFLRDLFLSLWACLFVIPGFVKAYSYRMVPYILKDNPELSATQVITKSREMMNGHKWRAFVLDLSFIGWWILTICTCGLVGIFWTDPYVYNTNAALYLELKNGNAAN